MRFCRIQRSISDSVTREDNADDDTRDDSVDDNLRSHPTNVDDSHSNADFEVEMDEATAVLANTKSNIKEDMRTREWYGSTSTRRTCCVVHRSQ